ncbi:MAG TPA: ABC transporter substrate-binding protein [Dehalococcoidia bacterium]|nr:ABC transporter substrate-binding protein [Dehalococcoidia bacterium]
MLLVALLASFRVRLALLSGIVLLLASACGGGGSDADTVTVQLDWTPNTNHAGVYLAQAKGWYKEAGIKVNILPYTDVNPDTVVANGKADIGISFPANVIFSRAAGLDLVSVAAVLQKNVTELAVLDSSDIKRPRDFDGRVYAGFGLPFEEPHIKTVIKADGGKGEFTTATLSTAAYEALYAKRADFTEIYTAWEGIEADMRGIKLRTFRYDSYGVPDFPGVIFVAKREAVTKRAAVLSRFLDATRKGYEFAAKEPDQAGKDFVAALPKGTFPEPEMVYRSAKMLAPAYVDAAGRWGENPASKWDAYSKFLLAQNVVTDDKQRVVKELPGGPLYTNELLAKQ